MLNLFELVVHSPERVYYMTRNRFLLYRRSYMPLKWKLKDMLRWLAKFSATLLLIAPRVEYARMTRRAIRDALLGRSGKLEARLRRCRFGASSARIGSRPWESSCCPLSWQLTSCSDG